MAGRTVAVKLSLEVGSYIQGAKNAAAATRDFSSAVAQEANKNKQAWHTASLGLLAFGAAAGAGVALAVSKFADFDQAMSNVQAATHESARNMNLLRDAALEAGAKTIFTAREAADGIEALAKAGVSTASILNGGLDGALSLAAAGAISVGDAAEVAATAMTQFRLEGSAVPHIADLLAAAAGKAQGDVSDMAQALKQSGLVASQMSLSVEETTGTLAAFASAGLIGSDAGTSFRTMLLRLTNPSKEAADILATLGINVYNAQGNFVGMSTLAGELSDKMSKLDPATRNAALATIFGSDAIRGANVLYQQGAQGITDWTNKVNEQGYAAKTAALRMDNLKGDIEQFTGSLDTAFIKAGSGANGALREMVQLATSAVNAFSALPGPAQEGALAVAAVTAAVALAGGAFLFAVPKVAAFNAAISEMGPRTQAFGRGFGAAASAVAGPLGIALAAGTVALSMYGSKRAEAQRQVEGFTEAIKKDSGAIGENTRALAVRELESSGVLRTAKTLGLSLQTVTDAALGNGDAMKVVSDRTNAYRLSLEHVAGGRVPTVATDVNNLSREVTGLADATEGGIAAAKRQDEALGDSADAAAGAAGQQGQLGSAIQETSAEAKAQADAIAALAQELAGFTDPAKAFSDALQTLQDADKTSAQKSADSYNKGIDDKIKATQREYDKRVEAANKTGSLAEEAITSDANHAAEAVAASGKRTAATADEKDARTAAMDAVQSKTKDSVQAIEDERDKTVAALGDQKKSWEDYSRDVTVSIDDYLAQLDKQVHAQEDWQKNMMTLAGRVSQGTLDELAKLGPEGAPLVAQLVTASDAQLAQLEKDFAAHSQAATEAWAQNLRDAQPVLAYVARVAGEGAAREVAASMASGKKSLDDVMGQYGLSIVNGVVIPMTAAEQSAKRMANYLGSINVTLPSGDVLTGSGIQYKAAGGWINGAGTGTSDSVPLMASNGEFIVSAYAARQNAGLLEAINSGRRFADGGWVSGRSRDFASAGSGSGTSNDNRISLVVQGNLTRETAIEAMHRLRDEQFAAGWVG